MKRKGLTLAFAIAALMSVSAFSFADQGKHKGHNPKFAKHKKHDCDCWQVDIRVQNGRWDDRRDNDRWRDDDRYRNDDRWRNDDRYRNDDRWRNDGRDEYWRREETKQEWRNIGKAAGFLSLLGMLDRDRTLVFAGQVGSLYAAYRYDEDRRSQDRIARARAYYFDQPYFYRDGNRYERHTVYQGGQKFYRFERCN